jgi:hypothetical protein
MRPSCFFNDASDRVERCGFVVCNVSVTLPLDGDSHKRFGTGIDTAFVHQLGKSSCDDRGVQRKHIKLVAQECTFWIGQIDFNLCVGSERFVVFIEVAIQDPIKASDQRVISVFSSPTSPLLVCLTSLVAAKRRRFINAVAKKRLAHKLSGAWMSNLGFVKGIVLGHFLSLMSS